MLTCLSAFWIHIPLVLWASAANLCGWVCPLTPLEKWLWRAAGSDGYEGGFLSHYFGPLLNLEGSPRQLEIQVGLIILAWNVLVYVTVWGLA